MKICSSSRLPLSPRLHPCKAHSTTAFILPPSSHLYYHFQQPLRSGRHQPKSFLCSRFPQTHRPPSSGGWIRHKCRQTSVKTTSPDHPAAAGAQRHQDDHDLPANGSKRDLEGGQKPAGLLVRIAAEPPSTTAGGPYLSPGQRFRPAAAIWRNRDAENLRPRKCLAANRMR